MEERGDLLVEHHALVSLEADLVLRLDQSPVDALEDALDDDFLLVGARSGWGCHGLERGDEVADVVLCEVDLSLLLLLLAESVELEHQDEAL